MNFKRIFNKSTIIYIIIILALAVLFNNNKTKRDSNNEGFQSNRVDKNKLSEIENINNKKEGFISNIELSKTLIPIYEEEKQNYISKFKNGEAIFNSIIDLSKLLTYSKTELEKIPKPSELSDLGNNIKTEIDILLDDIYNDFYITKIEDIDNYLNNEYNTKKNKFYNNYEQDYPGIKEYLDKEVLDNLLEKIDYTLANEGNSKNFKLEEESFVDNNSTILGNLNDVSGKLEAKQKEVDEDKKIIELKRKLTIIRAKISGNDGESTEELKKLMESFYNPSTTIQVSPSTTIPSPSLTSTNTTTTVYKPLLQQPASFDGLSNEELEIIKRNQIANTPQNIDTVLIDPLKAVENVQDDVLQLLENFNNTKKEKYLNSTFSFNNDPTNRGSYLVNSMTDRIQDNSISNLSYYSNKEHNSIYPNIISPKEKIQKVLFEKRTSAENNDLYMNYINSNSYTNAKQIEGFEDTSTTQQTTQAIETSKQPELLNTFDNFIKYSSSTILGLINKFTSGSIDLNNMDNNKMQSYGVVIIVVAILLFFISSSN